MSEIEVAEYVRTDNGLIGKYYINKNSINVITIKGKEIGIDIEKDIVKHSKNIIDLVNLYDYVNYFPIFDIIEYENAKKEVKLSTGDILEDKDIKTIWTKEQLKSIEYNIDN